MPCCQVITQRNDQGKYYSASCLCSGELQNSISDYKRSLCTHFCNRECPTARSLSFARALFGWYYPGKAPWQLTFTGCTSFHRHLSFDHGQYIPCGTLIIFWNNQKN
jgi:hypothetical protein